MIRKLYKKIYGDDAYPVWHRKLLPLESPRARYPGFKQETVRLKEGEIRREGAKPLECDIILDRDVQVTLRDGVNIYTDVFRPAEAGEYPAIVAWSPYGKQVGCQIYSDLPGNGGVDPHVVSTLNKFEGPDPAFWVKHGYVVLNVDIRGAYKSEGDICSLGRQAAEDGYDFIEWAAVQDWSNGKIAMAGNSWLAASQWFIAAERPPHLAAIAPWEGFADSMRDVGLIGGVSTIQFPQFVLSKLIGGGEIGDLPRMALSEPNDSPYWQDGSARHELTQVPAYVVASYDSILHTRGTFDAYRRLGSKDKWLRVHNTSIWHDLYANTPELLQFFDYYLKGIENGWLDTPRIRISVLDPSGVDDVARPVDAWPPAGYEHKPLYLASESSLSPNLPAKTGSVKYQVENGGSAAFRIAIDKDTEIVGYMKLRLWVEAQESDDMDLFVAIEKLDSNGNIIPRVIGNMAVTARSDEEKPDVVADPLRAIGFQRASRRRLDPNRSTPEEPYLLMQGEQRLSPGEIVPVDIAIWPTGFKVQAGEMLQVTILPVKSVPVSLPFGSARVDVPVDKFTYAPGEQVEMKTLGADQSTIPDWVFEQDVQAMPRNQGTHIFHFGGQYDSHLLVPLRK